MENKTLDVFLTGYGNFHGYKNPTGKFVNMVVEKRDVVNSVLEDGAEIKFGKVIEVVKASIDKDVCTVWKEVELSKASSKLLIHYGLSPSSPEVSLETRAVNWLEDLENDLFCPVEEGLPNQEWTRFPAEEASEKIKFRLHVEPSIDAGTYYCNYIYFKSLAQYKDNQKVSVVFVHVPLEKVMSLGDHFDFLVSLVNFFAKRNKQIGDK